jgi:hypothetical protein
MNERQLKLRTKEFALRVLKLVSALPKTIEGARLPISWFAPERQSEQITAPPVVAVRERTSSQHLE